MRRRSTPTSSVGFVRPPTQPEFTLSSTRATDLFVKQVGDESDRVDRAIARLKLAADAGADVLYPVGRHDDATQRRLTSELPLPINAIGIPDQDDPASFGPLGVARVSFGPFFQMALANRANEILGRWK